MKEIIRRQIEILEKMNELNSAMVEELMGAQRRPEFIEWSKDMQRETRENSVTIKKLVEAWAAAPEEEGDEEEVAYDEETEREKLYRALKGIGRNTIFLDDYFDRVAKTVPGITNAYVVLPDDARMKGNFDLYCTFGAIVHENDKDWISEQFFERIDFDLIEKKQVHYSQRNDLPPASELYKVHEYRI